MIFFENACSYENFARGHFSSKRSISYRKEIKMIKKYVGKNISEYFKLPRRLKTIDPDF